MMRMQRSIAYSISNTEQQDENPTRQQGTSLSPGVPRADEYFDEHLIVLTISHDTKMMITCEKERPATGQYKRRAHKQSQDAKFRGGMGASIVFRGGGESGQGRLHLRQTDRRVLDSA